MLNVRFLGVTFFILFVSSIGVTFADEDAQIITPSTSASDPAMAGIAARTHMKVLVPPGGFAKLHREMSARPMIGPPSQAAATAGYETPGSLACHYGITTPVADCPPLSATSTPVGGSKAIAVVLAYHYPNALKDLTAFSSQFGLYPVVSGISTATAAGFKTVYASGSTKAPATSPNGWELEGAMDIEWAHAMAPQAQLILVEAQTNSLADLLKAVDVATAQVASYGGGQVTMSWGSGEFAAENTATYENHFAANPSNPNKLPIVYFASSGDAAGTSWPCVSPNVVCVGGTTLRRSVGSGAFINEVAWTGSGGGVSTYFTTRPSYQSSLSSLTGRGVPDISLPADPVTGAWVFYTASNLRAPATGSWYFVGGTSWSSPTLAGMVNQAGGFYASSAAALTAIYGATNQYADMQSGWCGYFGGISSASGWDMCTGVGTPTAASFK